MIWKTLYRVYFTAESIGRQKNTVLNARNNGMILITLTSGSNVLEIVSNNQFIFYFESSCLSFVLWEDFCKKIILRAGTNKVKQKKMLWRQRLIFCVNCSWWDRWFMIGKVNIKPLMIETYWATNASLKFIFESALPMRLFRESFLDKRYAMNRKEDERRVREKLSKLA